VALSATTPEKSKIRQRMKLHIQYRQDAIGKHNAGYSILDN
jgi:hypothetical protein